jgi:nucleoside-diphosphate-sugar epimerase
MRVLVTGASGLLGRAVLKSLKDGGHEVTGTAYTRVKNGLVKLDLESADEVTVDDVIFC